MNALTEKNIDQLKNLSNVRWFAVYTKPRHEKKIREYLLEKDIESYVPLVKKIRQWSDRKKWVDEPLIRGYVFVRISLKQQLYVLETHGVVRFVTFQKELAMIPDFQIEALKRTVDEGFMLKPENYMRTGQLVEVCDGPLKGIKGRIQRIENENRFIISLDVIQASYQVRIDPAILKPVLEDKRTRHISLPLGM
jgi:transcription antitermination factor NusG